MRRGYLLDDCARSAPKFVLRPAGDHNDVVRDALTAFSFKNEFNLTVQNMKRLVLDRMPMLRVPLAGKQKDQSLAILTVDNGDHSGANLPETFNAVMV